MNWSVSLSHVLVNFVWQGAVFGLAGFAATKLLSSHQGRYSVLCSLLAAMILTPIVSLLTPSIGLFIDVKATQEAWITWVWALGTTVFLFRSMLDHRSASRIRRNASHPVPERWQVAFDRVAKLVNLPKRVSLQASLEIESPAVIGFLRTSILVPVSVASRLSMEQLEALIAHEVAHIHRFDPIVNHFQSIIEACLFFHPAVWWVSNQIRIEREHCCDQWAANLTQNPVALATALSELKQSQGYELVLAARKGSVASRITALGQRSGRNTRFRWLVVAPVCMALLIAIVGAGSPKVTTADHSSPMTVHAKIIVNSEVREVSFELPGGLPKESKTVQVRMVRYINHNGSLPSDQVERFVIFGT